MNIAERNLLIKEWKKANDALAKAKDTEMALRLKLASAVNPKNEKGTHNIDIGKGFTLKVVGKETTKVLPGVEKIVDKYPYLFKTQYSLVAKEYARLTGTKLNLVNAYLETKEAAPSITFVPPKEKA